MSSDPKDTVKEFLTKVGLSSEYDEKYHQFRSVVKVNVPALKRELDYPLAVTILPDWIVIEAAVVDLRNPPPSVNLEKIYDGLLRANFGFPEVNFALYQTLVVSLAWSKISALTQENFSTELNGVILGISKFPEIITYAKLLSMKPPKEFSPIYQ
jgi:hypothetical protein